MEVVRLPNGIFQVKHDGVEEELTLDEVMFLLSQSETGIDWEKKKYNANEDFWRSEND